MSNPPISRPTRTAHNPLPSALVDADGEDPDAIAPEDFDPYEIADESLRRRRGRRGVKRATVRGHHGAIPRELQLKLGEANLAFMDRRFSEAIEACKVVLKALPSSHEAYSLMALVHEESGDTRGCLDCYRLACAAAPRDANLWRRLAEAAERMGDKGTRQIALIKTAKLDPDDLNALLTLADVVFEAGDHAKAAKFYRRALEHPDLPNPLSLLLHLASLAQKRSDSVEFRACLTDVVNWGLGLPRQLWQAPGDAGARDKPDDASDEGGESDSSGFDTKAPADGGDAARSSARASGPVSRFRAGTHLLKIRSENRDEILYSLNALSQVLLSSREFSALASLIERAHAFLAGVKEPSLSTPDAVVASIALLPVELSARYAIALLYLKKWNVASRALLPLFNAPAANFPDLLALSVTALIYTGKRDAATAAFSKLIVRQSEATAAAGETGIDPIACAGAGAGAGVGAGAGAGAGEGAGAGAGAGADTKSIASAEESALMTLRLAPTLPTPFDFDSFTEWEPMRCLHPFPVDSSLVLPASTWGDVGLARALTFDADAALDAAGISLKFLHTQSVAPPTPALLLFVSLADMHDSIASDASATDAARAAAKSASIDCLLAAARIQPERLDVISRAVGVLLAVGRPSDAAIVLASNTTSELMKGEENFGRLLWTARQAAVIADGGSTTGGDLGIVLFEAALGLLHQHSALQYARFKRLAVILEMLAGDKGPGAGLRAFVGISTSIAETLKKIAPARALRLFSHTHRLLERAVEGVGLESSRASVTTISTAVLEDPAALPDLKALVDQLTAYEKLNPSNPHRGLRPPPVSHAPTEDAPPQSRKRKRKSVVERANADGVTGSEKAPDESDVSSLHGPKKRAPKKADADDASDGRPPAEEEGEGSGDELAEYRDAVEPEDIRVERNDAELRSVRARRERDLSQQLAPRISRLQTLSESLSLAMSSRGAGADGLRGGASRGVTFETAAVGSAVAAAELLDDASCDGVSLDRDGALKRLETIVSATNVLCGELRSLARDNPFDVGLWTLFRLMDTLSSSTVAEVTAMRIASAASDDERRSLVETHLSHVQSALAGSGSNAFRRCIVRSHTLHPSAPPLLLLSASESMASHSSWRYAVSGYSETHRLAPSEPLPLLGIATAFLNAGLSRATRNRSAAKARALTFIGEYSRARLARSGDAQLDDVSGEVPAAPVTLPMAPQNLPDHLLLAETQYNSARAVHELGLVHAAAAGYRAALDTLDDGFRAAAGSGPPTSGEEVACLQGGALDLSREIAYNLAIIAKMSGDAARARELTLRYLTYE